MSGRAGLIAVLVLLGAGWGLTIPLMKLAVSGDYRPMDIVIPGALALILAGLFLVSPRDNARPLGNTDENPSADRSR